MSLKFSFMQQFRFDLVDTLRILYQRRKFLLIISIAAGIISAGASLLLKNEFRSRAVFFPANALMNERINMFTKDNLQYIEYFGDEHDVDRVYAIGNSVPLKMYLFEKFKLGQHYKLDSTDKKYMEKLFKTFGGYYQLKKTDLDNIELTVVDQEPQMAADVANAAMMKIEEIYKGFMDDTRRHIMLALQNKMHVKDSSIASLTDSLVSLRDHYGIYDLISPGRKNLIAGAIRPNGKADFARGLETIQIVEEMKDRMVSDKAEYQSLYDQFRTTTDENLKLLHILEWAGPSGEKAWPFRSIIVLTAVLGTFIVSCILILLVSYFKQLAPSITKD